MNLSEFIDSLKGRDLSSSEIIELVKLHLTEQESLKNRYKKARVNWRQTSKRQKGYHWKLLRRKILARDGRICRYCGITEAVFHIDHIVPLARGGDNLEDNLCVACQPCNADKRDLLLSEWRGL